MAFTEFSSGTLAKSSEVNANYEEILKGSCDNAMSVEDTLDVMDTIDSPFKIVDLFTDSTGHKNTVTTGDTTAEYYVTDDYYFCTFDGSTAVLEPSFETVSNWSYSEVENGGCTITGSQDSGWSTLGTYSYKIDFTHSGSDETGSYGKITQTVDFTDIDFFYIDYKTVTTVPGEAIYASVKIGTNVVLNYNAGLGNVTSSTFYDCSGITGNQEIEIKLNITGDITTDTQFYVDNIQTNLSDSLIQSSAQAVGTGFNYAYLRPKLYESIPAGTSVKAQISLDGGSNWSTEQNTSEVFDISALTDTGSLKARIQLDTDVGATLTPKITGWAVQLYK